MVHFPVVELPIEALLKSYGILFKAALQNVFAAVCMRGRSYFISIGPEPTSYCIAATRSDFNVEYAKF
jgi:hypothetical protein